MEDTLSDLLPDWERHLKATNKAPLTIRSYLDVAREYLAFLVEHDRPTTAQGAGRAAVESYLVYLSERPNKRTGKPIKASQVAKHYRSLQQLYRWLSDVEEIIDTNPFHKLVPPAVPDVPVPVLSVDHLRALLKSCQGKTFENLRDRALLWLFIDTGCRADEVATLTVDTEDKPHLDFDQDVAVVLGKGRRPRSVPFSPKTGEALRRYLRARRRHPWSAKTDRLWIGRQGPLTASGLSAILDRRADDARIPHVHPHMFRHTFAHRWLVSGGQEQDLMRLAGWRSRQMLDRYGASAADERARQAYRKLQLDEDL